MGGEKEERKVEEEENGGRKGRENIYYVFRRNQGIPYARTISEFSQIIFSDEESQVFLVRALGGSHCPLISIISVLPQNLSKLLK